MKKIKIAISSLFIFSLFILPVAGAMTNDFQEQAYTIRAIKKVLPATVSIKITKLTTATNQTTGETYPFRPIRSPTLYFWIIFTKEFAPFIFMALISIIISPAPKPAFSAGLPAIMGKSFSVLP